MIFISKMIYDPHRKYNNKMGLTIGLTFHTPKFWDCHEYDFYTSQFDEMKPDGLSEDEMEHRYLAKLAHAKCKRKHMSYRGYAYWTGPKRRYTFRYMGATHPRERWYKPFSINKHSTYVRLRDNGPQRDEPKREREPWFDEIMEDHRRKFREAMDRSRQQMREYERTRSSKGKGSA